MHDLSIFINAKPIIFIHLCAALAALLLGLYQLKRKKGDPRHRLLGWIWVGLMAITAASSAFIPHFGRLSFYGLGPIHLFTVFVAIMLPRAVYFARRHQIETKRHIDQQRGCRRY